MDAIIARAKLVDEWLDSDPDVQAWASENIGAVVADVIRLAVIFKDENAEIFGEG